MTRNWSRNVLALIGIFFAVEGFLNLFYWADAGQTLFQIGRLLRMLLGIVIVIIAAGL